MHIAICIFGLLRSSHYTINSYQSRIIQPIVDAGFTYEVLLHNYKFSGTQNFKRNNEVIDSKLIDFTEWKLYEPSYYFEENQDKFDKTVNVSDYLSHGDFWENDGVSMKNHIRALHSLQHLSHVVAERNNALLNSTQKGNSKKFDYVIYARPDVYYTNDLPVQLIKLYPNKLLLPDFHRLCEGNEYNDRFAMGPPIPALIYGNRIDYLLKYSRHKTVQSESFVYDLLHEFNVPVVEIPFRFQRIRFSGSIHGRDISIITVYEQQKDYMEYIPLFIKYIFRIKSGSDFNYIGCSPHARVSVADLQRLTDYFMNHKKPVLHKPIIELDLLYQEDITYKQRIEKSFQYNERQACRSNLRGANNSTSKCT